MATHKEVAVHGISFWWLGPQRVWRLFRQLHSASPFSFWENLVWNLYFSIENIWENSYFKSQYWVYHCLRWKSLLRACLFWFIITWTLRAETAVNNLYQNFQSGLTEWQIGFSSFIFVWISKCYSTPFSSFSTDLLQERNQGSSNYLWILEGIDLSLFSLHSWSCLAKFLILLLWKGRGEFYTVKDREFLGRPQPHSSFNESKGSRTTFLPQAHSQWG